MKTEILKNVSFLNLGFQCETKLSRTARLLSLITRLMGKLLYYNSVYSKFELPLSTLSVPHIEADRKSGPGSGLF